MLVCSQLPPFSAHPVVRAPRRALPAPLLQGEAQAGRASPGRWGGPWHGPSRAYVPSPECGQARAECPPGVCRSPGVLVMASGRQGKRRHFVCCLVRFFWGDELLTDISGSGKSKHHECAFLPSARGPRGSRRAARGPLDCHKGVI